MQGWLSAAEELAAYEGIRLGDLDAFEALAGPLQPSLRRLAQLYADTSEADAIVRHSWLVVLHGDAMFRWQTPLATWVAAITVDSGRSYARSRDTAVHPTRLTPPGRALAGPADWADLPWSQRWEGVGARLDDALASLPLEEHEVLHTRDLEGWPTRRACDVLGLPAVVHDRLLAAARGRVHDAVGRHVGVAEPREPDVRRDEQLLALTRWLGRHADHRSEPLDADTLAVFQRWAAGRRRRWPRLTGRATEPVPRLSPRSVGPAGRRGG